ncbi:MAG: phosphoadenosine phosphosulfate reductase [Frankiales bacterium]|jgi:phosphoadenosine phosphosulfate reductase|nr:phosphoadenosine phosphosulfate reductase [Frankiales bacterium]MDX6208132.1 phosphoadenosine phosphosulfate reductase [Frankiales bacterium]MDX6214055.1 phosphoadenosine phosphosulfate reductase [Frankiales bacterium]MDX6221568.1 phosphoadenosine phosphosulfate reductase [Frankiales bacterium]
MTAELVDYTAAMADFATRAGERLEGATPIEILEWAAETFGDGLVVATSLQDSVTVDLASRVRPGIDVVFLDTGYHFAETIGMRDAVSSAYPVTFLNITPKQSVAEQDAQHGRDLWRTNPDQCCALRKVKPLEDALAPYTAWISGLRRVEAVTRRNAKAVEWDAKREMVKINPIVAWDDEELDKYIAHRGILINPLQYDGYPSIGCAPCTRRVAPGDDPRSGRWAGSGKVECGLHA